MFQMIHSGWITVIRNVNSFEIHHWVLAVVVLGVIGMICLKGLGVRGAR